MAGEWLNALAQAPNAGQAFMTGWQQAQERRERAALQQRQMQYEDEDRDLRRQQMQSQQATAQLEQHREAIKTGAAIIRRVQPRDDASWGQALGLLQQYGINPDQLGVPRQFDPSYVQNIVKLSEAFEKPPAPTEMERNFEFLQGRDPGLAEQYIRNRAEGAPLIANNGDGTFTIIPRNSVQPAGDDDEWEIIQPNGGQTPQASGNFRP